MAATSLKIWLRKLRHIIPLSSSLKVWASCVPRYVNQHVWRPGFSSSNSLVAAQRLARRNELSGSDSGIVTKDEAKRLVGRLDVVIFCDHKSDNSDADLDCFAEHNFSADEINITYVYTGFSHYACHNIMLDTLVDTCNQVFRSASSEFILLLHSTALLQPDTITTLLADAFSSGSDVAAWEARKQPFEQDRVYDPVSREIGYVESGCVLLRRSALNAVGGFDRRFSLDMAYIELSYRLREAGYWLRYTPAATIVSHINCQTFDAIGNFMLRARYGTKRDQWQVGLLLLQSFFKAPDWSMKKSLLSRWRSCYLPVADELKQENSSTLGPFEFYGFEYARRRLVTDVAPLVDVMNPRVSIITRTVAGRDLLLRQAGVSVFNQTYPNIEWIVVEDGGTDQASVLDQFPSSESVSVVYQGLEKVGRAMVGNRGMEIASGEWLMFLDDDDCLYADHVETLVSALMTHPECQAAYALAWEVESEICDQRIVEGGYYQVSAQQQDFDYQLLRHTNYIPIQSLLFCADLYKSRGGFTAHFDYLEDWHLWQRYGYNNQFIHVPKTTSLYRVPANMQTRCERRVQFDQAYEAVKQDAIRAVEKLGER